MATRRTRDVWDVIVIGGGIGGLTAAWQVSSRGFSVILLESEPVCGGQVSTVNKLHDWPATEIATSGVALAATMTQRLLSQGIDILFESVNQVAVERNLVIAETSDRGKRLRGRRAIVASGARLRSLKVEGEETLRGKGVSQCAYCDGGFFKGEEVVVVGGGDAAIQQAIVLATLCTSVHVVVRSELRAKFILSEQAYSQKNIHFVWDSEIEKIHGNDKVTGVSLRNVKTGEFSMVPCSGVFPFVGVDPNSIFLPKSVECDSSGHVLTNYESRTTDPICFAIGAVRANFSGDLITASGDAVSAAVAIERDLRA